MNLNANILSEIVHDLHISEKYSSIAISTQISACMSAIVLNETRYIKEYDEVFAIGCITKDNYFVRTLRVKYSPIHIDDGMDTINDMFIYAYNTNDVKLMRKLCETENVSMFDEFIEMAYRDDRFNVIRLLVTFANCTNLAHMARFFMVCRIPELIRLIIEKWDEISGGSALEIIYDSMYEDCDMDISDENVLEDHIDPQEGIMIAVKHLNLNAVKKFVGKGVTYNDCLIYMVMRNTYLYHDIIEYLISLKNYDMLTKVLNRLIFDNSIHEELPELSVYRFIKMCNEQGIELRLRDKNQQ